MSSHGSRTLGIYAYFAPLTLLFYLALPAGYLVDITTTYMLKDHLHASAMQVSMFRLVTAIPVYFAFGIGLVRDLWNPLGLRDRGYFLLFAPASALLFVGLAWLPLSVLGLTIGVVAVMLLFRFFAAAYLGLLALIGQERLMSGRLSVLWQVVQNVPAVAGAAAGGYLAEHVRPGTTFLIIAAITLAILTFAAWKPQAVFRGAYEQPLAKGSSFLGDLRRLVRHRAIYAPVLLIFLFQFSPGANTPLQYYLTNQLHASNALYGYYYAVFLAAFTPVYLLYGYLCQRIALKKLLFCGVLIAIPQMVPLAFIHSAAGALIFAVPMGMMGGMVFAAMNDLAIRSCPPGLQGTTMMLIDGLYYLSWRLGDVLGAWIYGTDRIHGFQYCVIAITVVYALMLPVLLLIPPGLAATADGEQNPVLEATVNAEVSGLGSAL